MLHINCRERGYYSSYGELSEIVTTRFLNTVACVGSPKIRFSDRYVQVTTCLLTQCSFVEFIFFLSFFQGADAFYNVSIRKVQGKYCL